MRKFYSVLLSAACTIAATATNQTASQNPVMLPVSKVQLNEGSVKDAQQTNRLTLTNGAQQLITTNNKQSVQATTDQTGTWESIGTGTWVEGPLDYYSDITAGSQWEVEIEENTATAGFYRLIPYVEGSVPAQLLGRADNVYLYVHAEDPTHVYTMGGETDGSDNNDWYTGFFGGFFISQTCAETGATTANIYGTLEDKVISFPANSHKIYTSSGWVNTNTAGKFKIYLPGAAVKDYTFETEALVCNNNETVPFEVTKVGADVANVYCSIFANAYTGDNVINQVYGMVKGDASKKIATGTTYTFTDAPGTYSIFMIATDANDEFVAGHIHHVFIYGTDDLSWTTLGTGTFVDPILVDAQYGAEDQTEGFNIEVTVQENANTPGSFRIVNPYDTLLGENKVAHGTHNHYIYFDATNPDEVKVKYNPVGFDGGYGAMTVWSVNDRYPSNTADELKNYGYGIITYDADNHLITIPAKSLYYAEKNYSNNTFFTSNTPGSLTIPELTAINEISADEDGTAVYYNLQGMKVDGDNLTPGIYVARKGNKAAKVFVK